MDCKNCNCSNVCYRCPYLSICNSIRIDELEEELKNLILTNTSILIGNQPPDDTLGYNHDLYFCCYPSSIWLKVDDVWIKKGNLICDFDGGIF